MEITRRFLTLILAAAALPSLWAQQPAAAERMQELKERLKLTPEQEEKVRPILQSEAEKLRAALQNVDRSSASRRDKRKLAREVRAIREDADKQLGSVLTKEQMSELKQFRQERKEQFRSERGRK